MSRNVFLLKRATFLMVLLFFSLKIIAQKPILVKNTTSKSFLKSAKLTEEISVENIDLALLELTIFHLLNSKSKVEYKRSPSLDAISTDLIKDNKNTYFEPSYRREKRLEKEAKKRCKAANYNAAYVDISFDNLPLLNLRKGRKYRFDKESETFIFPFKNNKKKLTPIPKHSYLSLAKQILRRISITGGNTILTNKQYEEMGLAIGIDQKSPTRMPNLKVFWIVGGYRLKMISLSTDTR